MPKPKLPTEKYKGKRLQVRLTVEEKDFLKKKSEYYKVSISVYIRYLLYLANHTKKQL